MREEKGESVTSRHPRGLAGNMATVGLLAYRADAHRSEVMRQDQAEALGHTFLGTPLRGNAMQRLRAFSVSNPSLGARGKRFSALRGAVSSAGDRSPPP